MSTNKRPSNKASAQTQERNAIGPIERLNWFAWLCDCLIDKRLQPVDICVAIFIARHINNGTGKTPPISAVDIARDGTKIAKPLAIGHATVERSIERLKKCGLGWKPGGGRGLANTYWIETPSPMREYEPKLPHGEAETPSRVSLNSLTSEAPTRLVTSSSDSVEASRPPTERGTRLLADWKPTDADWQLAGQLIGDRREIELTKFRNYWIAKAGKDARKLDWNRTWQNWVLKAQEMRKTTSGNHAAERKAKVNDKHEAALDQLKHAAYGSQGAVPSSGLPAVTLLSSAGWSRH